VTEQEAPAFRLAAQEYDPAIPVADIREHPKNPNEGDMGLLERSMAVHGFYGDILVQRSTGYILAGNHRYREAVRLGATALPGNWLEVDDDGAEEIMAMDNESTRRGANNRAKLLALLQPMDDARLARAGFRPADVTDLVALLRPPGLDELAAGLGEPGEEDGWPTVTVRVPRTVAAAWNDHCKTHGGDRAAAFAVLLGVPFTRQEAG
jgi:hypothetical protein